MTELHPIDDLMADDLLLDRLGARASGSGEPVESLLAALAVHADTPLTGRPARRRRRAGHRYLGAFAAVAIAASGAGVAAAVSLPPGSPGGAERAGAHLPAGDTARGAAGTDGDGRTPRAGDASRSEGADRADRADRGDGGASGGPFAPLTQRIALGVRPEDAASRPGEHARRGLVQDAALHVPGRPDGHHGDVTAGEQGRRAGGHDDASGARVGLRPGGAERPRQEGTRDAGPDGRDPKDGSDRKVGSDPKDARDRKDGSDTKGGRDRKDGRDGGADERGRDGGRDGGRDQGGRRDGERGERGGPDPSGGGDGRGGRHGRTLPAVVPAGVGSSPAHLPVVPLVGPSAPLSSPAS